ncbi:AAA family ATPase [Sinorhizobium sp. 7-81]|uniref:trifunctional serine/threonine-protein kinase/ATP-binding protein/sensor histidine kinase n=1 Tax=Sinorhizobium sp. 8-89 TaxID=3049089 RepID=UPI0024C2E214|nr:ATP-binding sensor histidine kinase [Sinorhizobium sp. 8-89]MDK1491883.1 AAA family ATPase [Sinorhizobium sp. 8-89]
MIDFDAAWLKSCVREAHSRYQHMEFCKLKEPDSGRTWEAASVPRTSAAAKSRLEADFQFGVERLANWQDPPVGLIQTPDEIVLIYAHASAAHLFDRPGGQPLDAFLRFALSAATAIGEAHRAGYVHCSLSPAYLALDCSGDIRLRGFGTAVHGSQLPGKRLLAVEPPSHDEIIYRAPEQLLPSNAYVDTRSDLYSLGVLLFQLLTGRLPLQSSTVSGWRHAHLAVEPYAVEDFRGDVPDVVGKILLRLLRKDPGARYQSAKALQFDLTRCQEEWASRGAIESFELGLVDAPIRRGGPQPLFGRAYEEAHLADILKQFDASREGAFVTISGPPGIGKSALFHSLSGKLASSAIFAQGKSDQQQRDIPYAPLVQVLRSVVDQAMRRGEHSLRDIRESLLERLDGHGKVVTDLVPTMELIVGPQPPLAEVPAHLAQTRVQRAILNTFVAFASALSPLVLFLDDLQWTDEPTLSVLKLLSAERFENLLCVGAYREEEAQALFASDGLIDTWRRSATPLTEISLRSLSVEAVQEIIATVLRNEPAAVASIAEIIHDKTAGNPFFVKQLLQALFEEGAIVFSVAARTWTWKTIDLLQYPYADNVVDFMIRRLDQTGPDAREMLRLMACIGPQVDGKLLSALLEVDFAELHKIANPLIASGLLTRRHDLFCFAHDRVQEAAYALSTPAQRAADHARIAHLMIDLTGFETSETAFAVASQVEGCDSEQLSFSARKLFVEVLVTALIHARSAAAVEQAARYGRTACGLMDEDWWSQCYHLAFRAHLLWCECLLATAALDEAAATVDQLLVRAASATEKASAYRLRANLLTLRSDYEGAITAALLGLDLLGIGLKRGASRAELDQAYEEVKRTLGGRNILELRDLPVMTDPRIKGAMALLATLISSIFTKDGLRFLHMAKMVELTLTHGTTSESAYGLSWFGVMIASLYDDYHDGFAYGQAALALVERHGYEEQHTATLVAVDQISAWTQPMSYSLDRVRDAIRIGHAAGDVGMTCYARNHLVSDLIIIGEDLSLVAAEAADAIKLTRALGYQDIEHLLTAQLNLVMTLAGGDANGGRQSVNWDFEGGKIVATSTLFWVQLYKGISLYFDGANDGAIPPLTAASDLIPLMAAHIDTSYCTLFLALALAGASDDWQQGSPVAQTLEAIHSRFAMWASINPGTFKNKVHLIEAEIARLQSKNEQASTLFDQSIQEAQSANFLHEQALALELAGRHCRKRSLKVSTHHFLKSSYDLYRRWGANRKAQRLAEEFPEIFVSETAGSIATPHSSLDLETVVEASQTLSKEMDLDRLVETLMKSMLVHAGANHGVLLLMENGEVRVHASAATKGKEVVISISPTAAPERLVPYAVIDTVMATRQPLVVTDATVDLQEPCQPELGGPAHSVLCVPLIRRGNLIGFIYLENTLLGGVFTESRATTIKLLATQAAISLDNARLYANLMRENELRSRSEAALRNARAELERTSKLTILGGIAASITHEIGQPLSAIAAHSGAAIRWLERPEPDMAEAVECLTSIDQSVRRINEIIRALRALSKQSPAVHLPISIDAVLAEVIQIAQSEIEASHVKIVLDLNTQDAIIRGDATQLKQVVLNLLTNAMEAMDKLPLEQRRIDITSRVIDEKAVSVSVRDYGEGVSAAVLPQVFNPLFTTKQTGMGMGLAICKSIVEAHGGPLTIQSAEIGTVLQFSIAIDRSASSEIHP